MGIDMTVMINQMIQLFLVIAMGYWLRRTGTIDDTFYDRLSSFVVNVTMPLMILGSVLESGTSVSLDTASVTWACVILLGGLPVTAWIITMLLPIKKDRKNLYRFMIIYPNIGFMGFPMLRSIFGDQSILGAAVINMCSNVSIFTLGRMVMSGGTEKGGFSISNMMTPGVLASLAAVFCYLVKLPCPAPITSALNLVGGMTTPLAMLLIGAVLAKIPAKEILVDVPAWLFAILFQLLIPAALYPLMRLTVTDDLLRGVTLVIAAMPVANCAVLFASEYHQDDIFAAKCLFTTTVISIVTIPLLVKWFLL